MTISLISTDKHKQLFACLAWGLLAVYLLVIHYSLSHTHGQRQSFSKAFTAFGIAQHQDFSDQSAENWHPDQHHTFACKLVPQASSSLVCWQSDHLFHPVQDTLNRFHTHEVPTPTKRLTRAPPLFA